MNANEFAEYWEQALADPDRIWPEDVLTNAEWDRGWFDRQILMGRQVEADRINHPAQFGGTAPKES